MVLVGDTGIGKSSLLLRFAENKFVGKALNSLSVDFVSCSHILYMYIYFLIMHYFE